MDNKQGPPPSLVEPPQIPFRKDGVEILKVSSKSRPKAVAGALATVVERDRKVVLHAIGAGAVNQAVKAIAIARGYVAPRGIDLATVIAFSSIEIEVSSGELSERTGIKFFVEARSV
ncbi:MAG: stage V sporulation protein S [Candidatus Riflebacteria bacterium]|nr:stage V sporulation protein S [Candidatus Riflebacteria bacterium]